MKATLTNQSPVLKRLYPNGVNEILYKASLLFKNCKKDTQFLGEDKAVVVHISGTNGGSANFADALASQGATRKVRFIVNRKREYQVYSVDGEAIAATNGDKGSIVRVLKEEMDKAMYRFDRAMAKRASGKGGGSIGVISSGTTLTSTTLTFASRTDIQWVEVGDQLQFADGDGTDPSADPADLLDGGETLTVSAVDRAAGSITVSAAINTIAGIATGDYVFRRGDYSRAMTGLLGWCPTSAPAASESFFGVDRTDYDVLRLSGFRYTAGAGGQKEALVINGAAEAAIHGIEVEMLYCNPLDYAAFINELGSVRQRNSSEDGKVGYKMIEIHTPAARGGTLKVVSDPGIPAGYGLAINNDEFVLGTAGECPSMLDHAGLGGRGLLTPQDDDAVQGRLGCYGNFWHVNPGNAIIFQF